MKPVAWMKPFEMSPTLPSPLAEWDAVKHGQLKKRAEKSTCYLVLSCTFSEVFKHTYKPPMQLIERPVSELVYSRSDYDGCRWWTTYHNENGKKTPPELVKEIDEFQNVLFKLPAFKTLEAMKCFCRYAEATSNPTEFNLYSETAHLYIRIRLITRFRDCNAYIYYYDSVDSIVFQNMPTSTVSKSVVDFFTEKSESEIQKYIALCQQAEALQEKN